MAIEKIPKKFSKFSIKQFNEVADCDNLYKLALKDADGVEIDDGDGGFLSVSILGAEAKEIQDFDKKMLKKNLVSIYKKKNAGDRLAEMPDIEMSEQQEIERVCLLVKSWHGFEEECNDENKALLFRQMPSFRKQISDASRDQRNFLKRR